GFVVVSFVDLALPTLATPGDVTAFAVIGMMAFFGSVSKAPIATILMVVEMTGSEALLVPAMVAIFIGFYIAGRYHLYEEQVPNRLASPAHTTEYFAEFLKHMPVAQALEHDVTAIAPSDSVEAAGFALSRSNHPVLSVVHGDQFVGELRLADILNVPPAQRPVRLVSEIVDTGPPLLTTNSNLLEAVGLMDNEGVDALLVVDATAPK
ncbi:Cl- channel voltage-gated family protein, partial [mine drainage metagenome]